VKKITTALKTVRLNNANATVMVVKHVAKHKLYCRCSWL